MSMAVPSPTGIICSTFAAKTSPRMMPLGMDRSMPAVAMTNVVPTLTTVRMATFWASSDRLLTVPNLPGAMQREEDDEHEEEGQRDEHLARHESTASGTAAARRRP